ncbi:MAG: hypothetical protein ACOH2I_05425 [Pseudomonas sp.]
MRQELAQAYEVQAHELEQVQALMETTAQLHAETAQQAAAERETAQAENSQINNELAKVLAKVEAIEQSHADQRKQNATEAHRAAAELARAQGERTDAINARGEPRHRKTPPSKV